LQDFARWHLPCSVCRRARYEAEPKPLTDSEERSIMQKSKQQTLMVALVAGLVAVAPLTAGAQDKMD